MKPRLLALPLVCFTVLMLSVVSARSQTLVTFDDLSETGSGAWFSIQYQGYQGLTWNNILCHNAVLATNSLFHGQLNGDFYGMVSPSNLAVMVPGCEIDSPCTKFNFLSAYFTGFLNSNLNIEAEGFNGAKEIYDKIVVASATNATLFTFDYMNIDRLDFTSSGGEPAFGVENDSSGIFIMDNFMFEFIPEPSSLLLTALGAVSLVAFLRRRRG
jgi:hypothetical protein